MSTATHELRNEFGIGYVYVRFEITGDRAVMSSRVQYEDEADHGKPVDGFAYYERPRTMTRAQARREYAALVARGYKA